MSFSGLYSKATYVADKAYYTTIDKAYTAASSIAGLAELDWLSSQGVPKAPDGLTDDEAAAATDGVQARHSWALRTVDGLNDRLHKGLPLRTNYQTLASIANALKEMNWKGIDDRKYLMEKVLVFASKLRAGSPISSLANSVIVSVLYGDLPHPPATFVGPDYMFRSADGSGNNVYIKTLGAAGQPYSRSVTAQHPIPASQLPDPELVFNALLKREKVRDDHPAGISSLLFSFATVIIHSLFRTSQLPGQRHINETSSYLDLSPLYGHNQAAQDTVRAHDGRGKLYEDVYAEQRVHMLPPSVSALLILFCRNHNYIAEKLLQINERRTWADPDKLPEDRRTAQDNEIFNTARLVNCGFFMNIILTDYLSAILGLVKEGNSWCLDPLEQVRTAEHDLLERGTGNACSVEFNLLYRWHATISVEDEQWTENLFKEIYPGENPETITFQTFVQGVAKINTGSPDPQLWDVPGLRRNKETKRYEDDDLAKVLQDATESAAQAFKARGTPSTMRIIEIMGMKEARDWGVCSMNEFRKFLGLEAYDSFKKWNPNEEVAHAAEMLYGHIDNLELYPGLMAEQPKPADVEGVGLCPGFTISRGILADAVALTRGDRFLTTDFTPHNLTAFGYQDCSRQTDNGSFGGTLGRLLFRHLPNHYHEGDVYAHFPMMTPSAMMKNLDKLDLKEKYNFSRPVNTPNVKGVNTHQAVKAILNSPEKFKTTYTANMNALTNGYGFFLAYDDKKRHDSDRQLLADCLFSDPNAYMKMEKYFFDKTEGLIREKSYALSGHHSRCVDIVRDVINLTPVHWVSEYLSGLPIKTDRTPHAPHTEQEAYMIYMAIFTFIFLDVAPEYAWYLRQEATMASNALLVHIERHLNALKSSSILNPFMWYDKAKHIMWGEDTDSHAFCRKLLAGAAGRNVTQLASNVLGVSVASAANYAHATAQVVNLYFDEKYAAERAEIIDIASKPATAEGMKLLQGYAREGMRLDPQAPGIFREVLKDGEVLDGDTIIHVRKGDTLFVSLANANKDPLVFKNPEVIDPTRPDADYMIFGDGMHKCLGNIFVIKTMPQALRAIFRLKNIRRGPGESGKLNRFTQDLYGTKQNMYLNANGMPTPWPVSMVIQYDN